MSVSTASLFADDQLWLKLREGEKQALEQIFHRYYDMLVRFVTPMLKDQEKARDLVQDLFYRLWTKREKIEINTSVKAYLFMACRNQALNTLKREQRMVWTDSEEEMEKQSGLEENTETRIKEKDLQKQLSKALEAIPPKCRQVFELSRFEHHSYKEIADILDISVKTVENQMSKALQILRLHLLPHLKSWVPLLFGLLW